MSVPVATFAMADGAVCRRAASTSDNQIGELSSVVPTYEKPAGAESIIGAKKGGTVGMTRGGWPILWSGPKSNGPPCPHAEAPPK